jgi:ATP dependent DNA ligase domain
MVQWISRSLARDRRPLPVGFIETCQPVLSNVVPIGPEWIHELKYDGWRILARKDSDRVRLWSRTAKDWTRAFPAIAHTVAALPLETCVLDGEAVAPGEDGWPKFRALRSAIDRDAATLMVFDLLLPWSRASRSIWSRIGVRGGGRRIRLLMPTRIIRAALVPERRSLAQARVSCRVGANVRRGDPHECDPSCAPFVLDLGFVNRARVCAGSEHPATDTALHEPIKPERRHLRLTNEYRDEATHPTAAVRTPEATPEPNDWPAGSAVLGRQLGCPAVHDTVAGAAERCDEHHYATLVSMFNPGRP